jgi:hypothetical protein
VSDILSKIHASLVSGGTLAIWDFAESDNDPSLVTSLFSLFFYMTSGSHCYNKTEIQKLLQTAGFRQFMAVRAPAPSPHILYTARKT